MTRQHDATMNSTINANRFRGIRFLLFLGWGLPLIAYGCVVLLTPDDAYNNFRLLKESSDLLRSWMLSISPMLDIYAHANTTVFVGTAKIASAFGFFCAAWIALLTLAFTSVTYIKLETSFKPVKGNSGITTKQLLGAVSWMPILGIATLLAFYCVKGDPSFGKGFTTHNRYGYLFISAIAVSFSGLIAGFWFFNVTVLFRRFFNKD